VLIGDSTQGYMILGTTGFLADCINGSGATATGPDSADFVPVNTESLLQWNPDIILTSSLKEAEAIAKDPKFSILNAVKNKKIISINADILLRKGQRVDRLIRNISKLFGGATEGESKA